MPEKFYSNSNDIILFYCDRIINHGEYDKIKIIDDIIGLDIERNSDMYPRHTDYGNYIFGYRGELRIVLYYIYYIVLQNKNERALCKNLSYYLSYISAEMINDVLNDDFSDLKEEDEFFNSEKTLKKMVYFFANLYSYNASMEELDITFTRDEIAYTLNQFFYNKTSKITDYEIQMLFLFLGEYGISYKLLSKYDEDKILSRALCIVKNLILFVEDEKRGYASQSKCHPEMEEENNEFVDPLDMTLNIL